MTDTQPTMWKKIMKKHFRLLQIIILLISFCSPAFSGDFKIFSAPMPPYSISKGMQLSGISVDILTQIMATAGYPLDAKDFKLVQGCYGLRTTQKGPKCIMLNCVKTKTNSPGFKWVGPMTTSKYVLIGKIDAEQDISIPKDLLSRKTATIFNSPPERALMTTGVPSNILKRSSSHVLPLRQLADKKIDYFATRAATATYQMKSLSMEPKDYKIIKVYKEVPLYFAFSKDTDDALIKKLNEALKALRKPGANGQSCYDMAVKEYLSDGIIK